MATAGGVGRWTRYFAVASALSMVTYQLLLLVDVPRRTAAIVGLFGAVLPMVFGMAYLLFPSYVGRTLATRRLPGVHFAVAYAGAGMIASDRLFDVDPRLVSAGALLWSTGVALFVVSLAWTVVPALVDNPAIVLRSRDRPQRSTRVATAVLPVGIGYLVVGTIALLSWATPSLAVLGTSLPGVIHYYAAGFAGFLIFALGARLATGFFHVSPPRYGTWIVLVCGGVAPGLLAANFWRPPWFLVGAGLEFVAVVGYAGLVGVVAYRTDRRRVGLYGITIGALYGAGGVGAATLLAFGIGTVPLAAVHVPAVLEGFLLLTIVGYAYQFFPVTSGQFTGATERVALATILLLAVGTALQAAGPVAGWPRLRTVGTAFALSGTAGYAYLLTRRIMH